MKSNCLNILLYCGLIGLGGCARAPIRNRDQAMRPVPVPALTDDLNLQNLSKAIRRDLQGLKSKYVSGQLTMRFGPKVVSTFRYAEKLQELLTLLKSVREQHSQSSDDQVFAFIKKNFAFYEVYGDRKWGEVFVTGYYEPILNGSRKKTAKYSAPILTLPKNSVTVDLPDFARDGVFGDCKGAKSGPCVINEVLRGRLVVSDSGRRVVEPFEPRESLVTSPLIRSQTHVIAWVDPIDEFFLEIQGSGEVDLRNLNHPKASPDKLFVTYAGQNGYPYVPIGRFVIGKIPKGQITKDRLVDYLRSLSPAQAQTLMDKNPSYVFFERSKSDARTELGVTATGNRTIATDSRYFAKGALGYLEFEKPVAGQLTDQFKLAHRFVLDQDTGGAIRGPGRVDLFFGSGPNADYESSRMQGYGRLYYLVPKGE